MYQAHPYANIFPMMSEAEKANLIKSMQDDGFDAGCPIVLYDGLILDGRNRYEAAQAAGVEPTFTTYEGSDPLAFVIRHNLHRRHLNETQRGLVASRLANMERGNFHGNQHKEVSANLRIPTESQRAVIANKLAEESDKWAEKIRQHTGSFKPMIKQSEAAEMLNVSERTIQTVKAVEREAPELLPLMEAGKMTAHEAMKEVKKQKRQEHIEKVKESIKHGEVKPIEEMLFEVIAIDPPWNYSEKGGSSSDDFDSDKNRGTVTYPTMTLEQIADIKLPASNDCTLFLWTTHAFLRSSFELLDKWGFNYKATIVWDKERMGMGRTIRMQCEFCLLATKGKPILMGDSIRDIIRETRREHSRKPDAFYALVESMTIGNRLEYFSREKRKNWHTYGAEKDLF